MTRLGDLRTKYQDRALSRNQQIQLDAVLKEGVRRMEDIYYDKRSFDPEARQQQVDDLLAQVEREISQVSAERRAPKKV